MIGGGVVVMTQVKAFTFDKGTDTNQERCQALSQSSKIANAKGVRIYFKDAIAETIKV